MSRLRIAVIGTGHLGRIHTRIAAGLPDAKLAAIVECDEATGKQVAADADTTYLRHHCDLFGLADAAILATPTSTHFQIARELLMGGVHVLVEKPITTSQEEADELVRLARKQQLVLQVGHVERFNPAFAAVQPYLGTPKYIQARRLSPYTFRSTDVGVVLDLMIHDIDAVLHLAKSPVTRVDAVGLSVLGNEEDIVDARLHFASGCIATLSASRVNTEAVRTMQIFSERCCARVDFGARRAEVIEPTVEVMSRQFHVDLLSAMEKNRLREQLFSELLVRRELPVTEVNAIEEEQLDFARAIRTGASPRVTGADGRDALSVAHAILERVRSHQWDGENGGRQGPFAMPQLESVLEAEDSWSMDDTVVLRRKAG